ncbi:MAG: hypothetical protein RLZZ143_27, partial [Cyanobacteriota bacterium]
LSGIEGGDGQTDTKSAFNSMINRQSHFKNPLPTSHSAIPFQEDLV